MVHGASKGTADLERRINDVKLRDVANDNGRSVSSKSSSKSKQPIFKPDKSPPRPHRMGSYTWERQDRKLDALFAIYVMGWETYSYNGNKWRCWIREYAKGKWEADMLPYFHDDTRQSHRAIELLRKEEIYFTVQSRVDGYEVVVKDHKVKDGISISTIDPDFNFAVMASALLIKGVSNKDIQYARDNQDDWTYKAKKRKKLV